MNAAPLPARIDPIAAGPTPRAIADRALALQWRELLAGAGGYSIWRAPFEEVATLRGGPLVREWTTDAGMIGWWERMLDGRIDPAAADALERRVHRFAAAWRAAEREFAAGRRSSPAFAILEVAAAGEIVPPRRPPAIDPLRKRRQRHRYKGAMADALEAFGRRYLVRDPRAGDHRPTWIDHRADCRAGRGEGQRCSAPCARIPIPPAPRWRRGEARRRRRDWLTVPEWLVDRAAAVRGCQDVIGLRDTTCGGVTVVPQSCHVRTCPDCESARQMRIVRTYRTALEELDPERARFLTLTIPNAPRGELAGAIAGLQEAAEKLRRRALWRGGACRPGPCRLCGARRKNHPTAACSSYAPRCRMPADPDRPGWQLPHQPVTAAILTLEVTHNDTTGAWHPHLHALLEAPYLDQAELSEVWNELAGGPIVWIESVRRHADDRFAGDVNRALHEVLKYAAKPHPAYVRREDPAIAAELLVALRGRHLVSTTGRLYGQGLEDPDEERDLVLVWPAGEGAERPYHAPRLCPHHGGPASWEVMPGTLRRDECTAVPDPTGRRRRSTYTWRPPAGAAGDTLGAIDQLHEDPDAAITGATRRI